MQTFVGIKNLVSLFVFSQENFCALSMHSLSKNYKKTPNSQFPGKIPKKEKLYFEQNLSEELKGAKLLRGRFWQRGSNLQY